MKRAGLILSLLVLFFAAQAFGAFGYYSPISINSGQVPSTQTDFPVLVSVTDARFKTVANGGHVQNASGFDIRPYTDSTLSTAITGYELVFYSATTGQIEMWVKVSSLSSSTTPFVLAYGDSGISTDGSSTTTWSNSFQGVYHLKDGTTLTLTDSTANGNNGTNHSGTATTGKIDGGLALASASSQYVDLGTGLNGATGSPNGITVSAWLNGTSFPNAYNSVVVRINVGAARVSGFYIKSNGKMACFLQPSGAGLVSYDGTGSNTLSTGTWYYSVMTWDNTLTTAALKGFLNGSQDGSANIAVASSINTTATTTDIGKDENTAGRFWNGAIDEVRVASVPRSTNWITTEYNNQSAPGTFETLGTEVAVTVAATGNFFLLFP